MTWERGVQGLFLYSRTTTPDEVILERKPFMFYRFFHEFAQDLPEEYRTAYLKNLQEENHSVASMSMTWLTASDALLSAFGWKNTPEGFYYWEKLYMTLKGELE